MALAGRFLECLASYLIVFFATCVLQVSTSTTEYMKIWQLYPLALITYKGLINVANIT